MAIQYKVDILAELKKKGYSSTRIREEKLIGQSYLQQLRRGELVYWKTLDTICFLLECQPGDLIEYVEALPGVYFGKFRPFAETGGVVCCTRPRNGTFVLKDGFPDCLRQSHTNPSDGPQRKKRREVPLGNLSPFFYLKSFRISSNAKSMAVFRLFCIIRIISASRMDCFFFFFFSLSFWLWVIVLFSPR